MAPEFKVLKADNLFLYSLCVAVRCAVFVGEQECPIELEFDAQEDDCMHYVAVESRGDDVIPLGTARWRGAKLDGKPAGKIERVAVMDEARGRGIAKAMMQAVIDDIEQDEQGFSAIILNSQDYAMRLYEKLGFVAYGDGNIDAEIPHHMMKKIIERKR